MIVNLLCLGCGLLVWLLPEIPLPRRAGRGYSVLRGFPKQLAGWLLMMTGLVGLIMQIDAVVMLALVVAVASLIVSLVELMPSPAPPTRAQIVRETRRVRTVVSRPQPPPVPATLTPALRETLENVVRQRRIEFDMLNMRDKTALRACETLSKLGYLDWSETGAGGRIQLFRPTGKAFALVEPDPPPLLSPESAVLTPDLLEQLVIVVHAEQVGFDLRYNVDRGALDACKTLSQMGLLDWTESGPGGSAQIFHPTETGRELVEPSLPPPKPGG